MSEFEYKGIPYEYPANGLNKIWFINKKIEYIVLNINDKNQGIMQRWRFEGYRWFIKNWKDGEHNGPRITFKY